MQRSDLAAPDGNDRFAASPIEEQVLGETRWHGHLVDAVSGAPLQGVKVGLFTRDRPEHIPMRSGPLGNVCTAWDLELGPTRAHIEATETTRAIKVLVVPPGDGATQVQDLVVPRRGGGVMGQCLDANGAPVPEARVLAWRVPLSGALRVEDANRSVRCDKEGRFRLLDLAGERGNPSRVVLMAFTEDLCTQEPFELTVRSASMRSGLELEMVPGWRVQGQVVVGERGREPAGGDRLTIPFPSTAGMSSRPGAAVEQEVRTELYWESNATATGRFSFLLPPVESNLAVARPGYVREVLDLRGPGDYFIRLLPGASLRGLVTDEGGLPLEGILVRLVERERVLMQETAEDGRFEFGGIELGTP
ncbi:MAG: carboxypeptidase-like regulatory domain-containing protein, partial [Planctomycetota bacterium]